MSAEPARVPATPDAPAGWGRPAGAGGTVTTAADAGRRLAALDDLLRLAVSGEPLDRLWPVLAAALGGLVPLDTLAVVLANGGRGDAEMIEIATDPEGRVAPRTARVPLAGSLAGRVLESGAPLRVDDLAGESRGLPGDRKNRSALLVPLLSRGGVTGAVVLTSTRPAAFGDADLEIVAELARPVAAAVEQRRLVEEGRRRTGELAQQAEENLRRARETRALLEAGRAVTASLDVDRTIRVILEEARNVLGADSCGLSTIDAATGDLVTIASLDLPPHELPRIRLRRGEGIAGLAVRERRPVQSADLWQDERVRFRDLPRAGGFRSMLAAPLRVGERDVGAISVFRGDVHQYSAEEESLLAALADQAAIALEHARLYRELEGMVRERTRELEEEKRFVEVVLEVLPLGVFVLDPGLAVVRANREGARVLGRDRGLRGPFLDLLPADRAAGVRDFLGAALGGTPITVREEEMIVGGEARIVRLIAAPLEPDGGPVRHLVLLVEDITLAKRLERQLLLTERLTIAGRLAAGVAHELNNPLATIAGCAEALVGRLREGDLTGEAGRADLEHDLGIIEEEAYRCKEITGSLLHFVRDPGSRRSACDMNAVVQRTVELLLHQARFAGAQVLTELDPVLPPASVNEGQLRQVFLGIASNALEAMDGRGTLIVRSRPARDGIEVEFEDEGPGIPEEILGRIFDPFFTTKPPGQGTGLGLAIAQSIVTDHGGRLEVASRSGRGSLFRVVLPR
jgi:two-component system NtrC family sensor kinase